jgi:hypothetical protein
LREEASRCIIHANEFSRKHSLFFFILTCYFDSFSSSFNWADASASNFDSLHPLFIHGHGLSLSLSLSLSFSLADCLEAQKDHRGEERREGCQEAYNYSPPGRPRPPPQESAAHFDRLSEGQHSRALPPGPRHSPVLHKWGGGTGRGRPRGGEETVPACERRAAFRRCVWGALHQLQARCSRARVDPLQRHKRLENHVRYAPRAGPFVYLGFLNFCATP